MTPAPKAEDQIAEIGIDQAGLLYVKPKTQTFPFIYRAAMGVSWDDDTGRLLSRMPRDWSYARWFEQVLEAVIDEYAVLLKIGPHTIWSNIPEDLQSEIESFSTPR
jgi:hypothetical protein